LRLKKISHCRLLSNSENLHSSLNAAVVSSSKRQKNSLCCMCENKISVLDKVQLTTEISHFPFLLHYILFKHIHFLCSSIFFSFKVPTHCSGKMKPDTFYRYQGGLTKTKEFYHYHCSVWRPLEWSILYSYFK